MTGDRREPAGRIMSGLMDAIALAKEIDAHFERARAEMPEIHEAAQACRQEPEGMTDE